MCVSSSGIYSFRKILHFEVFRDIAFSSVAAASGQWYSYALLIAGSYRLFLRGFSFSHKVFFIFSFFH